MKESKLHLDSFMSYSVLKLTFLSQFFYKFDLNWLNTMFSHLFFMISANRYRAQFLTSLDRHGIESNPKNYLRVMNLLEWRWDLTPDELVRIAFSVKEKPKMIFKIEVKRRKKIIYISIYLLKNYIFYIYI